VLMLGVRSKPQNRSRLLFPLAIHRIPLHKASPSDSQQAMREPHTLKNVLSIFTAKTVLCV